jgi:PAS domain S-box-containing protein
MQDGSRQAILIVDDEPEILSSLSSLLEEDFSVFALTSAEDALNLLKDVEISVIIADQRMPRLPGEEFLGMARERSDATRILITGYADISALIRAVNQGQIYTYLAKPWEPQHLKVTVAKAAEHCLLAKRLVHERDLLQALMNNIPDAIWFQDAVGRFSDVNKAAAAFLGVDDPSLVIGKNFSDFLSPQEAGEIRAQEERIIRLQQAETNQIDQFRWKQAGTRWMSTARAPIIESGGAVAGLVGVSRDITEQREADLALQRSEERYRQIVETAEEGVWIFDEHFRTLFVNGKMTAMLGLAGASEMVDRKVTDFLPAEIMTASLEQLAGLHAGRSKMALRLQRKDGRDVWVIVSGGPLLDSVGMPSGTLAMVTDLTERKALEERFRQAQKLEAVGRFAGGVAHDFNNVLTIISGHSQLLLRRLGAENPAVVNVEKIAAAADQAANLTRQILSFSRRKVVKPEVVDLNSIVINFGSMCRPILSNEIELITKLEPRASPLRADIGQIEQILMNLAVNACDAMPQGGKLTIETKNFNAIESATGLDSGGKTGPFVLLAVSDTGVGMDLDTQGQVFEPFFTTKEEGKGTGLGLSIVHGIVSQHDGWIELKSAPGLGTCFSIYLPKVTDQINTVPVSDGTEQWPGGNETILVIEDRRPLRELLRETLQSCGYRVIEASSGQEGLEVCQQHTQIELVVTDLVMPGLCGKEFAKALRAQRPHTHVLFMSGDDNQEWPAETPLLQKPFTPEALARKVRETLNEVRAERSILVADDDQEIRALLRSILEDEGYRVLTAENGKQAIAILKDTSIDLLVTDLVMPEQEGMETIAQARKRCPNLQILAVSGAFTGSLLDAASHFGAGAILEKPLQVDEVLRVIQTLLNPTDPAAL